MYRPNGRYRRSKLTKSLISLKFAVCLFSVAKRVLFVKIAKMGFAVMVSRVIMVRDRVAAAIGRYADNDR